MFTGIYRRGEMMMARLEMKRHAELLGHRHEHLSKARELQWYTYK